MQEKVEIITNHFEQYWTKIPKNGYCECAYNKEIKVSSNILYYKLYKGFANAKLQKTFVDNK